MAASRARSMAADLSVAHLQSEAAAAHAYAMHSPSLSGYALANGQPNHSPFQPAASTGSVSAAAQLHATQLAQTQSQSHSHLLQSQLGAFELDAPLSASAGGAAAQADVSRVQVLLRLLELEKRLARSDERIRMHEDATKLRLAEMASGSALSADRAAALVQRISEAELVARECAIGVQSVESKVGAEVEAIGALKAHVHSWRDEARRELRDELTRNINLRNATHHQELVQLMDKQQEQAAKIIRAHEMTTQAFHTKLHSLEAAHQAQLAAVEARVEQLTNEVAQRRAREEQVEQRFRDLEQRMAQAQQAHVALEAQLSPVHAQLESLQRTEEQNHAAHSTQLQTHYAQLQTHASQMGSVHTQVEYASNKLDERCASLEQSLRTLRDQQLAVQNSVMAVSDGLTANLTNLREALPSRADVDALAARLDPLQADVAQLRQAADEAGHSAEAQRKTLRRTTHSIQLVEEQLAHIQAKVLVASQQAATAPFHAMLGQGAGGAAAAAAVAAASRHMSSPLSSPRFGAQPQPQPPPPAQSPYGGVAFPGFASPPAAAAAAAPSSSSLPISVPHHSPFPSVPVPTPTMFGVAMHLSDAAGLRTSPRPPRDRRHQLSLDEEHADQLRSRPRSPVAYSRHNHNGHGGGGGGVGRAGNSAEEDFVANFLGTNV